MKANTMSDDAWIDDLLTFGGSRSKLRLLSVLAEAKGPLYLGELIDIFTARRWPANRTYLSKMLNELEKAECVIIDLPPDKRPGRSVRYEINHKHVHQVLTAVNAALTQHDANTPPA